MRYIFFLIIFTLCFTLVLSFGFTTNQNSFCKTNNNPPLEKSLTKIPTATFLHYLNQEDTLDLTMSFNSPNQNNLDELISQLHDKKSPNYHKWLTPKEFGERFGIAQQDYIQLSNWLTQQGFEVTRQWPNRLQINFRATVSQISKAFHTNISLYLLDGKEFFANENQPSFPPEFAYLIKDIYGLENFSLPHPLINQTNFTSNNTTALAPKDLHQLFNLTNVIASGNNGKNQNIAIVARSNFSTQDIEKFQTDFKLPLKKVKKLFPFGLVKNLGKNEEQEVLLDTQWAGAIAPAAKVTAVIAPDIERSLQYIVNNLSQIKSISLSFGLCEENLGNNIYFFHDLYTQAVAQGQTVFVSSGDDGANDCNDRLGQQVNGLASSPNCVAVGGTSLSVEYDKKGNATLLNSQKAWLFSGGGDSIIFTKPIYQQNISGTSQLNHRSLPDVAQVSDPNIPGAWIARHNRLECCLGGTSLATPIWAGFFALVTQRVGAQGNFNFKIYQLGNTQLTGQLVTVFNDVTEGNNSTKNVPGFSALMGYDRVTGWGSFNGQLFLEAIK